ncbi:kelch domain-containing protein 10 isoform X2 [Paroedura picta]|uniref:kelch domain-containing protein 10 isoform X2 n=1 Tax=Paroedura picta TaxID=143630 RepID=UPI004056393A
MSAADGEAWDGNRQRGGGSGDGPAAQASHGGLLNRFVRLPPGPGRGGQRVPPARSGHRCVADNANLYVFGGYNPAESEGPENENYPLFRELWRYNFATSTWHQMGTEGYMPRELASMSLVLHGNNLLVFGGTGIPFGESNGNDVHVCNVKYKRWALFTCRGKKPNRIYGQAMAIINGSLYVFGGTTGYIYSTDLHKLDLNTREWIQLKPNNLHCDMPEERYRHEIAHDGQRIYILGGGTSWTAYSLDKVTGRAAEVFCHDPRLQPRNKHLGGDHNQALQEKRVPCRQEMSQLRADKERRLRVRRLQRRSDPRRRVEAEPADLPVGEAPGHHARAGLLPLRCGDSGWLHVRPRRRGGHRSKPTDWVSL